MCAGDSVYEVVDSIAGLCNYFHMIDYIFIHRLVRIEILSTNIINTHEDT